MSEPYRFTLPTNPNLYVDLRTSWPWGLSKELERVRVAAESVEAGALAFADTLLLRVILAWNLKDGDGNALTVSGKNVDEYLDGDDAQAIIQKAIELRKPALAVVSDPNSSTA